MLERQKRKIADFPTGELWLQYMSMVELLQQFPRVERTGDFLLHVSSLQKMLPYLAASGHSNYTKSAHMYISDMLNLEKTNPIVRINSLFQVTLSLDKVAGSAVG